MAKQTRRTPRRQGITLEKCQTGIRGLDDITEGGLPRGRPTLVCGGAGSGKTLMAMEFIVRGISRYDEPGVFMTFEESASELAANFASLGFDLDQMVADGKLAIDSVYIERSEIEETGEYDLEGLFVRLGAQVDAVGAKRVALDGLDSLFAGLPNEAILRAELRRLFRWLKERGLTAVVTGEQGERTLTRHGFEEYVSDCVIQLDHHISNQVATRRLRVVKYRGSRHGTNEYPTMIDSNGLSVLPISMLGLVYPVSTRRVTTGIPRLDAMLGGKGFFKGTTILVSGTTGTGKSSVASAFADSVCRRGGRCLYVSYEESPEQLVRNMRSIGFDLGAWVTKGLLRYYSVRPTVHGLESHLIALHGEVDGFEPEAVVVDPLTNLSAIGDDREIKSMLTRMIDFLKGRGVTALFTSLTTAGTAFDQSEVGISSLIDTWILLRTVESASERNRVMYVLKSRGMAHSNQMRELLLSDAGISLVDVYTGAGAVATGTARLTQEALDIQEALTEERTADKHERELKQEQVAVRGKLEALQLRHAALTKELEIAQASERQRVRAAASGRRAMAKARKAD